MYPTPQTIPSETAIYTVRLPNDSSVRGAFLDALYTFLLRSYRWEQSQGGVSPEDVVSAIIDRIGALSFTVE